MSLLHRGSRPTRASRRCRASVHLPGRGRDGDQDPLGARAENPPHPGGTDAGPLPGIRRDPRFGLRRGRGQVPVRSSPRRKEPLPRPAALARSASRCECASPDGVPSSFVGKGGCILCGMCVRLCDDVMKIGALIVRGPRHAAARDHARSANRPNSALAAALAASICPDRRDRVAAHSVATAHADSRPSSSRGWPTASRSIVPFPKPSRACRSSTRTPASISRPAAARSAKTTARSGRHRPHHAGQRGRDRGRQHHHGHRLEAVRLQADSAVRLRAAAQRLHKPRIRAALQRRRADQRQDRPARRQYRAEIGGYHPLRRQPRRQDTIPIARRSAAWRR